MRAIWNGIVGCVFVSAAMVLANEGTKQWKLAMAGAPPNAAVIMDGKVVDVHDADTVTVAVTTYYQVRLLDCWAPEVTGIEKPMGLESKAHLKALLDKNGPDVRLEFLNGPQDWKNTTLGRRLGTIWPAGKPQAPSYNQQLVTDQYAAPTKAELAELMLRWKSAHKPR